MKVIRTVVVDDRSVQYFKLTDDYYAYLKETGVTRIEIDGDVHEVEYYEDRAPCNLTHLCQLTKGDFKVVSSPGDDRFYMRVRFTNSTSDYWYEIHEPTYKTLRIDDKVRITGCSSTATVFSLCAANVPPNEAVRRKLPACGVQVLGPSPPVFYIGVRFSEGGKTYEFTGSREFCDELRVGDRLDIRSYSNIATVVYIESAPRNSGLSHKPLHTANTHKIDSQPEARNALLNADYSQVEARLLAMAKQDNSNIRLDVKDRRIVVDMEKSSSEYMKWLAALKNTPQPVTSLGIDFSALEDYTALFIGEKSLFKAPVSPTNRSVTMKIETVTQINGTNASMYDTNKLIDMIKQLKESNTELGKVGVESKKIATMIAENEANITKLVAILDER